MANGEYTMAQVVKKTGVSKSTLVRWEKNGLFSKPKRRARTHARIFTDAHIKKIEEERAKTEEPPDDTKKAATKGKK